MGYTHYWSQPLVPLDQGTWNKFVADCRHLAKNLPDETTSAGSRGEDPLWLTGCSRYKNPQFNRNMIYFNGGLPGPRKSEGRFSWVNDELSHETFALFRKGSLPDYDKGRAYAFGFCKTARKPYDLMVCACLILFKYYFGSTVEVHSDGEEDTDWRPAFEFVAEELPHGMDVIKAVKLLDLFEDVFDRAS